MVNDLLVRERHAGTHGGRDLVATCGNALPLFTGGQVVAGSNPASPTQVREVFGLTRPQSRDHLSRVG
jgi:hypothetical protein